MQKRRYMVASGLATVALIVAGCGGSSKSSSQTTAATTQTGSTVAQTTTGTPTTTGATQPGSSGAPLTRVAFINKADLVCARLNAIRASNKIDSTQSFIQSVTNISADEQQFLQEMAQIQPPASMKSTWNRMIDDYKSLATTIDKIKQELTEKDTRHINSLLIVSLKDQRKAAAVAKSAGFKDCATVA